MSLDSTVIIADKPGNTSFRILDYKLDKPHVIDSSVKHSANQEPVNIILSVKQPILAVKPGQEN